MADFSLIKIEGKPLEKLIDVISKGIGTVYKPRAIKKEAEAKAYEIEIIERAKSKAIAEGKEIHAVTLDKIQERFIHKEIKRQNNIDNVTQIAVEQISQENDVSEVPVDEDWSTRFFNIVEDVSDEEMQKLWGRILAGEVKQPNSYSLRTLEILKNLSKEEATIFTKFAKLAITAGSEAFVVNPDHNEFLTTQFGIQFVDRLILEEAGLITANDLEFSLKVKNQRSSLVFGNFIILIDRKDVSNQSLPVLAFTKAGTEMLKLVEQPLNITYLNKISELLTTEGVDLSYSRITEIKEGLYYFAQPIINLKR